MMHMLDTVSAHILHQRSLRCESSGDSIKRARIPRLPESSFKVTLRPNQNGPIQADLIGLRRPHSTMTSPAPPLSQQRMHVDVIKQHTGPVQVTRRVQVDIPGKHFPGLQAAEQSAVYKGTAVEYKERHKFAQHAKAWGAAHAGPGIRFVCESDALDDPDHKGFWTTRVNEARAGSGQGPDPGPDPGPGSLQCGRAPVR